ncbi:MAG: hypothetical protein K2J20_04600, partial [Bacilli bacterium]|nr:hypothetical protein [Bacilli bacterium]
RHLFVPITYNPTMSNTICANKEDNSKLDSSDEVRAALNKIDAITKLLEPKRKEEIDAQVLL